MSMCPHCRQPMPERSTDVTELVAERPVTEPPPPLADLLAGLPAFAATYETTDAAAVREEACAPASPLAFTHLEADK